MAPKTYLVIFEKAKHNWSACVPDMPGCVAPCEDAGRNTAGDSGGYGVPYRGPAVGGSAGS